MDNDKGNKLQMISKYILFHYHDLINKEVVIKEITKDKRKGGGTKPPLG